MATSANTGTAGLRKLAIDVLFPARCAGYGAEEQFLLARCLGKQQRLYQPDYPASVGGPDAYLITSILLSCVLSCFAMESAIRHAVHDLKCNGVHAMEPFLCDFLGRQSPECRMRFDAVVPVLGRIRQPWRVGQ